MDLVLRLREFRRMRGLTQREAAELSGIGEKTISSFETGERIDSLKMSQLVRLLKVYGVTGEDFFGKPLEMSDWSEDEQSSHHRRAVWQRMSQLPTSVEASLLAKIDLMLETAEEVQSITSRVRPYAGEHVEWQMLNSRN